MQTFRHPVGVRDRPCKWRGSARSGPMINLWQLQVFLVVYETGSFSSAATRLHMTQPGVSQQIRSLENYLGTKLFVRRGHRVELTAAGEGLIDPARRLITLSET